MIDELRLGSMAGTVTGVIIGFGLINILVLVLLWIKINAVFQLFGRLVSIAGKFSDELERQNEAKQVNDPNQPNPPNPPSPYVVRG
jgi:hypothetical protein